MFGQAGATALTWAIAIVGSYVLLKLTAALCRGLRVTESDEFDGLDLTQHGESSYNLEDAMSATFGGGGGGATLLGSTSADRRADSIDVPAATAARQH
jgi:Ammonium Transporter Family